MTPPADVIRRLLGGAQKDIADLRGEFERRARAAAERARTDLAEIARREADELRTLLDAQRARILRESQAKEAAQLELDLTDPAERRQREADRKHWQKRLADIEHEIGTEPARVAASYDIRAERLEPVSLIYLWPQP